MLVAAGIAAGATLALDQVTKAMTRTAMEPNETRDLALGGQVGIGHIQNFGSAYGLVPNMPTWVPAVGTAVIGGALLAVGARHGAGSRGAFTTMAAGIGAGLVIGGGLGNVIDRAHQGHVTDMLHTTDMFGYYNVADIAVNAGLVAGVGAIMFAR
ncbi:MAG: lipoprotein signal peptidase [Thermoleophilia bacterium]|nr:lipoprotein signal peptidase [Thermoleophilia bacterium]